MNLSIQTFLADLVIFKYPLLLIVVTLAYIDLKIGPPVFWSFVSFDQKCFISLLPVPKTQVNVILFFTLASSTWLNSMFKWDCIAFVCI